MKKDHTYGTVSSIRVVIKALSLEWTHAHSFVPTYLPTYLLIIDLKSLRSSS